jgi:hypothetical protein
MSSLLSLCISSLSATALDVHCLLDKYQISRDKPNQIRWDRPTNKQQWPLKQQRHTNSALQRPAYHVSWFNIPLNCVPGKMGWPHDLTRQTDSNPESSEPSLPHTHTHYIFVSGVMLFERRKQSLALLADKKLLYNIKNTKLVRNYLVPCYICLHILSSISR